jgi:hypothetical protein
MPARLAAVGAFAVLVVLALYAVGIDVTGAILDTVSGTTAWFGTSLLSAVGLQ